MHVDVDWARKKDEWKIIIVFPCSNSYQQTKNKSDEHAEEQGTRQQTHLPNKKRRKKNILLQV